MNRDKDPYERLSARATELEEMCTHMQQTVGVMDQVILEQQKRVEVLEANLVKLADEVHVMASPGVQTSPIEEERPPHY